MANHDETPIHGYVLEAILSHVPLIDLVAASHVSMPWNNAVSSSLRTFNKPKPWLIVHTQSTRSPCTFSSHGYDPRSGSWLEISQPSSMKHVSALRSSHSNMLYMLSPSKLSFSFDPLNQTWHHVDPPRASRTDPIVARVGGSIIIAGGTCEFEDDPLAVEVYTFDSCKWEMCESMPDTINHSAASTCLSTATTEDKLIVTGKFSGVTYCFDPKTKSWSGPNALRPDQHIFYSIIGYSSDRLILLGIIGEFENIVGAKIWNVNKENFDCEVVGEMPPTLIPKLKSEAFGMLSISMCLAGDYAYIYESSEAREVVVCEFKTGGGCRWWSLENAVAMDGNRTERVVFTCSNVGLHDLERAMRSQNGTRSVKL